MNKEIEELLKRLKDNAMHDEFLIRNNTSLENAKTLINKINSDFSKLENYIIEMEKENATLKTKANKWDEINNYDWWNSGFKKGGKNDLLLKSLDLKLVELEKEKTEILKKYIPLNLEREIEALQNENSRLIENQKGLISIEEAKKTIKANCFTFNDVSISEAVEIGCYVECNIKDLIVELDKMNDTPCKLVSLDKIKKIIDENVKYTSDYDKCMDALERLKAGSLNEK